MFLKVLLCAVLLCFLCGTACNKVTYVNPGTMPTAQVHSETGWYFVLGLAGTHDIWVRRECPSGVHEIQSRFTFGDMLLSLLTGGLVTPRTYVIQCGRAIR